MKNLLALGLVALFAAPMVQAQKTVDKAVRVEKAQIDAFKKDVEARLGLGVFSAKVGRDLENMRPEQFRLAKELVDVAANVRLSVGFLALSGATKTEARTLQNRGLSSLVGMLAIEQGGTVMLRDRSGQLVNTFVETTGSKSKEAADLVEQFKAAQQEYVDTNNMEALRNTTKIFEEAEGFLARGSTGLSGGNLKVISMAYAVRAAAWNFMIDTDPALKAWRSEGKRPEKLKELMSDSKRGQKWEDVLRCMLGSVAA